MRIMFRKGNIIMNTEKYIIDLIHEVFVLKNAIAEKQHEINILKIKHGKL